MQINDWSLRTVAPIEMKTGFGWIQAKPACSVAPVAVTPDELDTAWRDARVDLPLVVDLNGERFGAAEGYHMSYGFDELIAHAARTRKLVAGTIIGSGTVSNKFEGGEGKKIEHGGVGYSCIAEIRMIEKIQTGEFITPFMSFGDTVGIEMNDAKGQSIFGRIENKVEPYNT